MPVGAALNYGIKSTKPANLDCDSHVHCCIIDTCHFSWALLGVQYGMSGWLRAELGHLAGT